MPSRLAYSPKVYAYTKDSSDTTYNLTPWLVSGQVQRLINQASSASLTLRNPYKQFTTPRDGNVAFHPMDPITIYMERIAGFPVRVFTGYLDQTPYYQLYPGTITLAATCTLKRLKYTYFDPALPYLMAFFARYGWVRYGDTSIINPNTLGGGQTKLNTTVAQDASFGKLLWATLYEIGDWQDTEIYIEQLPEGIAERMAALMQTMQKDQQTASNEFNQFMKAIIGSGSYGNSKNAPSTGPSKLIPGQKMTVTASVYTGSGGGACGTGLGMTFAELTGNNYSNISHVTRQNANALGGLACGTPIDVTYQGKTIQITKSDIGLGGAGMNGHARAIDLYIDAWTALGLSFPGPGLINVEVTLPKKSSPNTGVDSPGSGKGHR